MMSWIPGHMEESFYKHTQTQSASIVLRNHRFFFFFQRKKELLWKYFAKLPKVNAKQSAQN